LDGDGGVPLAIGEGLGFPREAHFKRALVVEHFHAEGKLCGGHGVLLADEDDFLGVLGDVVRLVHLGELFELLALVG
jgi:hypothetical protein